MPFRFMMRRPGDAEKAVEWAQELMDKLGPCLLTIEPASSGKRRTLDQNALVHVWFREICEYINKFGGHTEVFTEEDIKERLLVELVGQVTRKVGTVDVVTVPKTSLMTAGELNHFMVQVEHWAAERRIPITIPAESDYRQYIEIQNQ